MRIIYKTCQFWLEKGAILILSDKNALIQNGNCGMRKRVIWKEVDGRVERPEVISSDEKVDSSWSIINSSKHVNVKFKFKIFEDRNQSVQLVGFSNRLQCKNSTFSSSFGLFCSLNFSIRVTEAGMLRIHLASCASFGNLVW